MSLVPVHVPKFPHLQVRRLSPYPGSSLTSSCATYLSAVCPQRMLRPVSANTRGSLECFCRLQGLGGLERGLLTNGSGNNTVWMDHSWPGDLGSTPIPENLKGRVFGLGGPDVHPTIQNVSASILVRDTGTAELDFTVLY